MKYPFMIIHDRNYNLIQNEEDLANISFSILESISDMYTLNWYHIKKAKKVLDGRLPKIEAWDIIKERGDIEVVDFDNVDYNKIINV